MAVRKVRFSLAGWATVLTILVGIETGQLAHASPFVEAGVGGREAYIAIESATDLIPQSPFQESFHFSTSFGDDENDCSSGAPCRTFDRAAEICSASHVECIFRSGDYWTGSDIGNGFGYGKSLNSSCVASDELCVLLRSSDSSAPAFVDCAGAELEDGLFTANGHGGGWVGILGFNIRNCDEDVVDTAGSAKVIVANVAARVGLGTGSTNAFTSHDTSRLVVLNSIGTTQGYGRNPAIASIHESMAILIGDKPLVNRSSARGADVVTVGGDAKVFIAGHTIRGGTPSVGMEGIEVNASDGGNASAQIFSVIVSDLVFPGSCFRVVANGSNERAEIAVFNSSCTRSDDGISIDSTDLSAMVDVQMRGSIIDEISGHVLDHLGSIWTTQLDIRNSVFDEDDRPFPWKLDSVEYSNRSFLTGSPWSSLFEDDESRESGGSGVDGDQWSSGPGEISSPESGCAPSRECDDSFEGLPTITLPFCIPAAVLDEEVCSFDFSIDQPRDLGAPPRGGGRENVGPIIDPVGHILVAHGSNVTVNASAEDGDGPGVLGWHWSSLEAPNGWQLPVVSDTSSLDLGEMGAGLYRFRVLAHDGIDASEAQEFWVNVAPVPEPTNSSLLIAGIVWMAGLSMDSKRRSANSVVSERSTTQSH